MQRREFITLLGGAASAWPLAARAQQPDRVRRVGVLMGIAADLEGQARIAAFRQALQVLNWTEGHNIHLVYRWSAGDPVQARRFAKELLDLRSDVNLVNSTPVAVAVRDIARTMPRFQTAVASTCRAEPRSWLKERPDPPQRTTGRELSPQESEQRQVSLS